MGKFFSILFIQFIIVTTHGQMQIPIGQWRNHLPMRQAVGIEQDGNIALVATQYGLFRYSFLTREFNVLTTSQGLSDVRVKMLSKDPLSSVYLIAYANGNMDLVNGDRIDNIPDILRASVQENKSIFHGLWAGSDVLLSTGLGIVIVNTSRKEIRERVRVGPNGSNAEVFQTTLLGDQLFAATSIGLRKATYPNAALSNPSQWSDENLSITSGAVRKVLKWNDKLVIQKNDSILVRNNGNWNVLYSSTDPITSVDVSSGKLILGKTLGNKGDLLIFSNTDNPPLQVTNPSIKKPVGAISLNNQFWIADAENGLVTITGAASEVIVPAAPYGNALGRGATLNENIFATAGSLGASGRPAGIFIYDGNSWTNLTAQKNTLLDSVKDINVVVTDPVTEFIWAGSFGGGLLEISKNDNIRIYKYGSFISSSAVDPRSFRISGLAFDSKGNLWISNHGSSKPLVVRKSDGSHKSFQIPVPNNGNTISDIIIDDADRKWILGGPGNGLICFDDAGTPDQTNDDQWRLFTQGRGNGNLPSSTVLSVTTDRNGFIWVGTDRGVALIQCGDDLFNPAQCEAILPVVQQNNVAGLLLANEQINDIKVDGADRKWFATDNGVWLLSTDAQKIIYRFTKSNGKLLSNQVLSLVIQQKTGEVFFFTADGICSFRSTATEPQAEPKKLFVFPNPVPSGYSGNIAIRGLAANAWVRITELDGKLVYQTRSLGGQAIWNGKNYKGDRASSGVYLIYTGDENNRQQLAGKIFFIR